ncbi:MAG: hypothetical protein BGO78_00295 [Chloroflexi bacterium 44-23]|nr:MAG: hypothetical protein BGO78_00295 [Chloroflexi bacterium 44-23]
MIESPDELEKWARFLHEKRLAGIFKFLHEAGAPLNIIFAQFLYLSAPFLPGKNLSSLASVLENKRDSENFLISLENLEENG